MGADRTSSVKSRRILRVMLDTGSTTTTVINCKYLPKHYKLCKKNTTRIVNTLNGSSNLSEMVVLWNRRWPELDSAHNIDQQKALVFESNTCQIDIILGTDFLSITGIDVKYSTHTVEWFDS